MDLEKNKIGNITTEKIGDNIVVKSDTTIFSEELYFSKIYEEGVYKRFIKNTEKLIRTSKEYTDYIDKLRSNIGALNIDNILSNITTADVDLEFHHYPFSLYDIVDTVATHKFVNQEPFNTFSLAKEIMELHFKNMIGLVPLTITNHELAHGGNLFISSNQIFGNYKKFIEDYKIGVSGEILERIQKMEELTSNDTPSDFRGLF